MEVLLVLVCAISTWILYHLALRYRRRRILSKIPSPSAGFFGHIGFLLRNPGPEQVFDYLRECAANKWPIYRLSLPIITAVGFLHPDDFEIVLSQMKHLSKSTLYGFLESWLGQGLLTSTGTKWQKRRKLLTRAFHFNVLQKFIEIFNEETDNLIKSVELKDTTQPIDIVPLITHMTLQSMIDTSMGVNHVDGPSIETYRSNIHKIGRLLLRRVTKPWNRYPVIYHFTNDGKESKSVITSLHEFTDRVIKEREKQILQEPYENLVSTSYSGRKIMKMLDMLLFEKIKENAIDYEGIREEVDTFLFEGHDTTAAALVFLFYSLALHPEIQEKVRQEVSEIVGSNAHPTFQELQNLAYTERVIKESLRLYPSVPFVSRIASEEFTSATGYVIPKGSVLHLHIFDLHRNPRIYPEPLKFDPDRFLPENSNKRHPFAYLPFSAGPRNCIGQKFAMLEIKAAVTGLLRKFRLEMEEPAELRFAADLILRVNNDIKLKFTPL